MLVIVGCPRAATLRARIEAAARRLGVPVRIREQVVTDDVDADAWRFPGSPTVLVDGRDPFRLPGLTPSLACRLYRGVGTADGVPNLQAIVDALGCSAVNDADAP